MARPQTPGPRRPQTPEQIAARDASAEAAEIDQAQRAILRRMQTSLRSTPRHAITFTEAARRLGVSIDTLERRGPPPSLLPPIAKPGQRAVRRCDESEVEALLESAAAHAAWLRIKTAREAALALLADTTEAELEVMAQRAVKQGVPRARVRERLRLDESGTSLLFARFAAGLGEGPGRWPFLRYERQWPAADMHIDDVVDLETACTDGVDGAGWIGPRDAKGKRGAARIEWLSWTEWAAVRTRAETARARVPATTAVLAAQKAVSPSWRRGD